MTKLATKKEKDMKNVIGGMNFEDLGISESSYLNNNEIHEEYEIFYGKYEMLTKLMQNMSRQIVRAERNDETTVAEMIKTSFKKLFIIENSHNPYFEMDCIEVEDKCGQYNGKTIKVLTYQGVAPQYNGNYKVIMPPVLVDKDRWLFTPCIVSNVRNK